MRNTILISLLIVLIFFPYSLTGQEKKTTLYLIPGQGADSTQFANLRFDDQFEVKNVKYFTPEKGWRMDDFARALSAQIDTSKKIAIIGVSLGGMLATEMADFLEPEKIIIISSAKHRKELPGRYRFQNVIPFYKIFPARAIKRSAKYAQAIVEPDSKNDREVFVTMLENKDPDFLKRTIKMIIGWKRETYSKEIIHIHGDSDNTIPIRNVHYDYLIPDGSHMMVYTRASEISTLINKILLED
jgi:esterase/lipase